LARLEQDNATVGENAPHLILLPNDLAARAVERHDALRGLAVLAAMNDVQRLGVAGEHMHEGALVAEILDRAVHEVEPGSRFFRRHFAHHGKCEQQQRVA